MLKYSWLVLIFAFFQVNAQVKFAEDNSAFGQNKVYSQLPIAVSDVNGDYLDDIVLLDKGNFLSLFLQHENTRSFSYFALGKVANNDQYALNLVDLNNDGSSEILCGGYYDGIKVYSKFGDENIYLKSNSTTIDFYTQNISMHDFDRDGYLDLFVCDDDAAPKIFMNKDGEDLIEAPDLVDFSTTPASDNSGNYSSIFTDFDDDGDIDFYISKCRQDVDSETDPRRINQLFVNDGSGDFSEEAVAYGLANGEQTWVTSFEDLDNDGDKDVVMLNHTGTNLLFENTGDQNYIQRQMNTDFEESFFGLQLVVRDFDNDGLKDIFIAGSESRMYWNKGDFSFEKAAGFLSGKSPYSAATGDLNNDGFWDIYASYARAYGSENPFITDKIHLNTRNEHNYLKLSLIGNESNLDAIGSAIHFYGNWGVQHYELRNGQSYGTIDSRSIILGMGSETSFDSLVISWPGGSKSLIQDLVINTHHILQENKCKAAQTSISYEGGNIICSDSELLLSSPAGSDYLWSDGRSSQDVSLTQGGIVNVKYVDSAGCVNTTPSIRIEDISQIEKPFVHIIDRAAAYCKDDIIVVSTQYEDVTWSPNNQSQIVYLEVDSVLFVDYNICDTVRSDTTFLEILHVPKPEIIGDTIELGEDLQIETEDEFSWFSDQISGEVIYQGNNFQVNDLLSDTTFYVEKEMNFVRRDSFIFRQEPQEISLPPDNINGGIIFEVKNTLTVLGSVKCYSDVEANRKIILRDYFGNVINERLAFIGPNDSIVDLDFILPPFGYYLLTTDAAVNEENFGKKSPGLKRAKFSDSPFNLTSESGNVKLLSSTGTPVDYYSFFDLKFVELDKTCTSDRIPVFIKVRDDSAVDEINYSDFEISPNPSTGNIKFKSEITEYLNYEVISLQGQVLLKGKLRTDENLDISNLRSGIYFIKIHAKNQAALKKIVKL